jgi:hypothetical protein
MKRKLLVLVIASTVVMMNISISMASEKGISEYNSNRKKWTFLLYCDTDYGQYADGIGPFIINQLEDVGSNDLLDVLVLWDSQDDGAFLYQIMKDNSSEIHPKIIDDLGEINIGDYTVLRDFISKAKTDFTAERYMLVLFDHGGAWQGACWDATLDKNDSDNITWNDHLTMDEIQKALHESGGINIIGFSGCLMGCIESAYELRDCTEVYLGSEEMNGCGSWPWASILGVLFDNCEDTTFSICEKIISEFKEINPYFGNPGYWRIAIQTALMYRRLLPWLNPPAFTMSAVRSDKIYELAFAMDNFSKVLIDNLDKYKSKITLNRFRTDDFPIPMSLLPPYILGDQIDIYHFIELMSRISGNDSNSSLKDAAEYVKICLNEAINAEHHQIGHRNTHGLSVYFPTPFKKSYNSEYDDFGYGLDFTRDTHWDEFLTLYLNQMGDSNESNLDQNQTEIRAGAVICRKWVWAQSFIPRIGNLTRVKIPLSKKGIIFSNIIVSIRDNLYGNDLTVVSQSPYHIPRLFPTWIEFDFDDISVIPGDTYYLVCKTNLGNNKINFYGWSHSASDIYEKGDAWIGWNKGSDWEIWDFPPDNPKFDFCFKTYG